MTRVGSPSVCESTTRMTEAAGDATPDSRRAPLSGIDLHRLDPGVEFARCRTLLATPRARCLHAAERRVGIDARRVAVDAYHPGLDSIDVLERRAEIASV